MRLVLVSDPERVEAVQGRGNFKGARPGEISRMSLTLMIGIESVQTGVVKKFNKALYHRFQSPIHQAAGREMEGIPYCPGLTGVHELFHAAQINHLIAKAMASTDLASIFTSRFPREGSRLSHTGILDPTSDKGDVVSISR